MPEINFDIFEQKKFLENIIQNEPPYKKLEFNTNWYKDFVNISDIAISTFCNNCDAERVFNANIYETIRKLMGSDVIRLSGGIAVGNPNPNQYKSLGQRIKGKSYFLNFEMKCAMCGEIHYFSLVFTENTVVKIGQYPSFTNDEVKNIRKYKNLISKYYPELTRSINAYSQGMGVASFVYLRRILEHLVEKKYTGDLSLKFCDKLQEVEKTEQIIPKELEPIKNEIYSILSKGVHEYEEDECLSLYLSVKYVIERLLDIELEKKNNKDKALAAMATIKSKLQEDTNNG